MLVCETGVLTRYLTKKRVEDLCRVPVELTPLSEYEASKVKGQEVLVFGEAARVRLGLPPLLIEGIKMGEIIYRLLPHPVHQSFWYEDDICTDLAALVLKEHLETQG